MPDRFPEAFERMPEKYKKVDTFQELVVNTKDWGKGKMPMTKPQLKALAIEADALGIKDYVVEESYIKSNGKIGTRFRNTATGYFAKSKDEKQLIPVWRHRDTIYEKGETINTVTGERYRVRAENGYFLKKSEWTFTDKDGNTRKLHEGD